MTAASSPVQRVPSDTMQRTWFLAGGVVTATLLADQITKALIRSWLGPDAAVGRWEAAGRLLALEYVENRGAAFGLLAGQTWLLVLAAVGAALIFVFGLAKQAPASTLVTIGLGLLLGGALGNLIDRVRLGYVVDFIAVGIWPKFNIADSAITVGLVLLGWYALAGDDASSRR